MFFNVSISSVSLLMHNYSQHSASGCRSWCPRCVISLSLSVFSLSLLVLNAFSHLVQLDMTSCKCCFLERPTEAAAAANLTSYFVLFKGLCSPNKYLQENLCIVYCRMYINKDLLFGWL